MDVPPPAERSVGGAGLTAGLAFAGMPKLVGHVGLGHLSLVAAVCWSPWVLLSVGRAVSFADERWLRPFVLTGILLGVSFVADPRWFMPLSLSAVGYGVWRWITREPSGQVASRRLAAGGFAALAGATAVAAGLAIPFSEFVMHTTRAGLATAASDAYALPSERLVGLVVAARGGWAEWMVSMGSVTLVAAAAGASASWRRCGFWLGLLLATLVLALGVATPVGRLIAAIPGAGLVRVPPRWLFLFGTALAALAAYGVDLFEQGFDPIHIRRAKLAAFLAAGVIILISIAIGVLASIPAAATGSGLFALLTLILFVVAGRERRPSWALPLVPALLVAELCWIDASLIQPRPAAVALARGEAVTQSLSDLGEGERSFSPSYSVPQEAAAGVGLELADGVHPLQLSDYVALMADATGFEAAEYSVTLPPFPSGDPQEDWGPRIDADTLGLLAVSRIVSAYPLEADGLELASKGENVFVYLNDEARPRAWVESSSEAPPSASRPVSSISWKPNHVSVVAAGPGTLVLSDPIYPGWRAEVDGRAVPVFTYRGILRSVELPPGSHQIDFEFIPQTLIAGLAASLLAAAVAFWLWRRA
jgi:hypothetical protein